jgi:dipeptidyl aminopeptidase/acylaminoacyl peptidase
MNFKATLAYCKQPGININDMRFFLTIILFFCANYLYAQKPVIDSVAYKKWPAFSWDRPIISKNGKYVFYTIGNLPVGSKTLVVQSTDGKWKKEFRGGLKDGNSGALSNKCFFFINKNDSLGMLTLGTNQIKYIPNISWCNLLEIKGTEYLKYPLGLNSKAFVLKNLKTNKERIFTDVDSYSCEGDMLVLIKSVQGTNGRQSINLADIITGKVTKIWEGFKPENLILDVKHRQLAFKTGDSVWYYKFDSANAVCISDKNSSGVDSGLTLGYLESFSQDGKFVFTSLIGKGEPIKPKNGVVEIWSYSDVQLQTEQEKAANDQKYIAVIDLEDHRLTRLQQQEEESFQFSKSEHSTATVALIENPIVGAPWSNAYRRVWDLVTLKNGKRVRLNFLDGIGSGGATLSPCGKYILWFDRVKQGYCCYEIATDAIRNLTKGITVSWANLDRDDLPSASSYGRGIATWLKDDESALVYDRYDIWKIDPLNKERPINLTNGYGKNNQIVFNCIFSSNNENLVSKNERLYLTAFNKENKNNGFFLKHLDKTGDPELLHMGPYLYQTNTSYVEDDGVPPIKAKNADIYVVRRMSATDAPNYFSTKDFKIFTRLTDLQPQKKYNWYTTELHSWKSLDGRKLQGILYKPENFDRNKNYPVIFHYYERKSDGLNAYLQPEALCNGCNINIPNYVSNGYLVFSSDIYYKIGDPMQGTYDAIVSAANYVSSLPFINAKRIGLQGCSFGGIQTNYLVTHTNLFAAAVSSSGFSDWVSHYGGLFSESGIAFSDSYHEGGQTRIGVSLWEKPEAYIKSSPIFQVDKITTPLLIMQGKKDPACLFSNTLEFYLGLRRMGKKAWMLAYPEGGHGLGGNDANDFGTRMMQFFDHYLKDKAAPLWMIDGVAAKDRSWKAGLELDTKGRTPGPGLLTPEEQAKVELMMTRKPITIILK